MQTIINTVDISIIVLSLLNINGHNNKTYDIHSAMSVGATTITSPET